MFMRKKVVIAIPTQSTYYLCLKRAFDFLGWEYHFFDFREFTPSEKILAAVLKNRDRAIRLLNSRFQKVLTEIKPSWMLTIKGETLLSESLEYAHRLGIKTVNWFPDSFRVKDHILDVAHDYDYFIHYDSLVCEYLQKSRFQNVSHLSYAADLLPSDPDPVYGSSRIYPVSFIGNFFPPREKLFRRVSSPELSIWGNEPWKKSSLSERYQGVCPFAGVNDILSKTKISINLHYAKRSNGANLRVFETARAGACLLTDRKKDVEKLYSRGEEIITYESDGEFEEKIKELIANPGLTRKVGMKSFLRTKNENTYVHRIRAILNTIQ